MGMARLILRFWQVPRREKLLLAEAVVFVAASRLALWCRRKENSWRPLGIPMWTVGGVDVERVAWAVRVTAAQIPEASCLTQAMAGREMLERRGVASEIRLGVAMEKGFQAHAWLVVEGRILLGGGVEEGYTLLGTLPVRERESKA